MYFCTNFSHPPPKLSQCALMSMLINIGYFNTPSPYHCFIKCQCVGGDYQAQYNTPNPP